MLSTRGGREYYEHELSESDHVRLLQVVARIKAKVMISGYPSRLYDVALKDWKRQTFTAYTRAHSKRTEVLWMNYDRPTVPHDLSYVGADYRERWKIKKRQRRWSARLKAMEPTERAALFAALVEVMGQGGPAGP